MVTTLQEQFEAAAAASKSLSQKPSNDTLLQLYSLYKQATEGNASDEKPANPLDFVAKAKYEAWVSLKGLPGNEAMQRYIDLVKKLSE